MEQTLTQQQVKSILDNAPQGVDKKLIIKKLIDKGYALEGFPSAKVETQLPNEQSKIGYSNTGQELMQTGRDIVGTVKETGQKIAEAQRMSMSGEQSPIESGFQMAGALASGVSGVVGDVVKGGVQAVLPQEAETALKAGMATGFQKASDVLSKYEQLKQTKPALAGAINLVLGSTPEATLGVIDLVKGYDKLKTTNPRLARNLDAALGIGELALDVATLGGAKAGTTVLKEGAKEVAEVAGKQATKVAGEVATQVGRAGAKVGSATKTITEPITASLSETFSPEKIMQRVARISKPEQAKFQKLTGESVGDYLVSRDIYGNEEEILTKLYNRFSDSKSEADTALEQLQGTYKPKQVKTALSELVKREKAVSSPGAMSEDSKRVTKLLGKYEKDGLTMSEINEVKRLYERNVRVDYLKSSASNPERVVKATNLDSAIRNWQMEQAEKLGLQNLSEINKETQAAKSLLDSLGKEVAGSAGNNALGLTDAVLVSGGDPTAIGMLVGKKILTSKGVQSAIAKRLAKGVTKKTPIKAKFGKPKKDLADFLKSQELKAK